MNKLNHCQQVEIIKRLLQGFLSARFDNIANLNKEVANMAATAFLTKIILPRLELLKQTGQDMEDGLTIRRAIMKMSNDYLEFTDLKGKKTMIEGKGNLEEYYQKEKAQFKKSLINSRKKCQS
jgi:hypothetical protein